ncbi:hypothetical protein NKDENANG_04166 [Candidatus Entotheonellaceae bacterium PAL068K]
MASRATMVIQPQGRANSAVGKGGSEKRRPAADRQREVITCCIGLMPNLKRC